MTQHSVVEERLVRTLQRAAELAVPEDAVTGTWDPGEAPRVSRFDVDGSLTVRRRRARHWAVAGVAASIFVIAVVTGALVLAGPSPASRISLPANQGSQLLCEATHCHNLGPGPSLPDASASSVSPKSGAPLPSENPTSLWVVSSGNHLPSTFRGTELPGTKGSRPRGVLYLRARNGQYYRFVTSAPVGQLSVVSRERNLITLRSANGARYNLDLATNELSQT